MLILRKGPRKEAFGIPNVTKAGREESPMITTFRNCLIIWIVRKLFLSHETYKVVAIDRQR